MSSTRLARSTKSRLFVYICAVLAFGMVVYMFHGGQVQLDDSRKSLAACNQQTESLSAQLQVIFEYKLRLEKSLQKEKTEHKQTKEDCQSQAKILQDNKEQEQVEASKKYTALLQSYNLLQAKQKDLEEENNELRKKNIKLLDDLSVQKKQLTAKVTEEQQIRQNKERDMEHVKSRQFELEVTNNKLEEENNQLKKDLDPNTNRVAELQKNNNQLMRELESVKRKLDDCVGATRHVNEFKEYKASPGDILSGIDPPKYLIANKLNFNSTTPVINPEAVIDHDVSSPKTSISKGTKTSNQDNGMKSTQVAASPLEVPLKQQDNEAGMDFNRQIPLPNNMEPPQSPENTVIKKPDYSDKDRKNKDDLMIENQGGEEDNVIAKPMNPIQEPVPQQKQNALAMQWEEEGPQNGAHEEGEDDAAAADHHGWRGGENGALPRVMGREYPAVGGDYPEKDNQEEEEDEEGEQMDYVGGDIAAKHHRPKYRQFDRNGGGGVRLNPK